MSRQRSETSCLFPQGFPTFTDHGAETFSTSGEEEGGLFKREEEGKSFYYLPLNYLGHKVLTVYNYGAELVWLQSSSYLQTVV